jgi:hypothetical protein
MTRYSQTSNNRRANNKQDTLNYSRKRETNANLLRGGGYGDDDAMYKVDKQISSITRNVASKNELHSLVLMLFLFTADQYIEQTDSFTSYYRKKVNESGVNSAKSQIDKLFADNYNYVKKNVEITPTSKDDSYDDLTLTNPMLYKSEILEFAYKIARIVNKYHVLFNNIFKTATNENAKGIIRYRKVGGGGFVEIKERSFPLETDMISDIGLILSGKNLLQMTINNDAPTVVETAVNNENNPTVDNEPELGELNESNKEALPYAKQTDGPSLFDADTPIDNNIKTKYITVEIDKVIKDARQNITTTATAVVELVTNYESPNAHPYYPVENKNDWIYGDVDKLLRYALAFTGLLKVVKTKYDAIDNFEKGLMQDNKPIVDSKRNRENYVIMRGKNFIGKSKLWQKYSSGVRGVKAIGSAVGTVASVASNVSGATSAASYLGSKTMAVKNTLFNKTGGSKKIRRRHARASKKIKKRRRKYARVKRTLKTGGGFTEIGKKTAMFLDQQTGISKAARTTSPFYYNLPHEKIAFTQSHSSKYELLLYLEKMYDLYNVNAFSAGEELPGEELGLSPKLNELLNTVKENEMKEIEDEQMILLKMRAFYLTSVDPVTRLKNGIDEGFTQGRKLFNYFSRAANGQMRMINASRTMMRNMFKQMRALVGFMNRNGILGYAIGMLHLAANALPVCAPVFPPAVALSVLAAATRNVLILITSPVLEPPPVILKRKEDILKAATNMLRRDSKGQVKGDDFLKKMLDYYDYLYVVTTGPKNKSESDLYSLPIKLRTLNAAAQPQKDNTNAANENKQFIEAINTSKQLISTMVKETSNLSTRAE